MESLTEQDIIIAVLSVYVVISLVASIKLLHDLNRVQKKINDIINNN